MISKDIIEIFRKSKENMPEESIKKIDEIWDDLVTATASSEKSLSAESDAAFEDNVNEEAEHSALAKLYLLLQDKVDDLERKIEVGRQELTILERENRFMRGEKIYPNEPCPCGSGKKYKKCCGRLKDRTESPLFEK